MRCEVIAARCSFPSIQSITTHCPISRHGCEWRPTTPHPKSEGVGRPVWTGMNRRRGGRAGGQANEGRHFTPSFVHPSSWWPVTQRDQPFARSGVVGQRRPSFPALYRAALQHCPPPTCSDLPCFHMLRRCVCPLLLWCTAHHAHATQRTDARGAVDIGGPRRCTCSFASQRTARGPAIHSQSSRRRRRRRVENQPASASALDW